MVVATARSYSRLFALVAQLPLPLLAVTLLVSQLSLGLSLVQMVYALHEYLLTSVLPEANLVDLIRARVDVPQHMAE